VNIVWLNDSLTEALVTRGWWRKRQARVYLFTEGGTWRYRIDSSRVGFWLDESLDRARVKERKRRTRYWQPVLPLPKARVAK
jgi:hypothetical protein